MKKVSSGGPKKRAWSQIITGYSWMEAPEVVKYNANGYDIRFSDINFHGITTKMKLQVSDHVPISKLLQFAEEMVDGMFSYYQLVTLTFYCITEGKYQQALRVLEETMEKGGGIFSPEDRVQYEYLSAQAHAQLDNYQEAMKALNSLSESGVEIDSSIMQGSAFSKLRSIRGFSALEKRFRSKKKKKNAKKEEGLLCSSTYYRY